MQTTQLFPEIFLRQREQGRGLLASPTSTRLAPQDHSTNTMRVSSLGFSRTNEIAFGGSVEAQCG